MEVHMANEYGFYRKKNNHRMNGNPEPDYPVNAHQAPDDSGLPDYTGKPRQTARNTPHAGRQDTFSVRFGQGMNAVADTKDAISDPDNAASTRLFQAGRHDTVSSAIQDEHHPDNAASTRLFQGMNHDVAQNTFGAQYDLDKQPSSSFWKDVQGNGRRVSGLDVVEKTDREVGNLDYDNHGKDAYSHSKAFYNGFGNAVMNVMMEEYRGTEFGRASEYPDLYTSKTPLQTSYDDVKELGQLNDGFNRQYQKERYQYTEPTAEAVSRASEKYSHILGGIAGVSLLSAVRGTLPQTGMTLSLNNWSRLSHNIYRRVLEQTGNDEFALALGYGAIGTLASDLQPFGLASKKAPLDYQSVLDPVSRVIDSVVSDSISNKFVDMTVDNMARDIEKKKDQGNDK